jgi:hypothetical protein
MSEKRRRGRPRLPMGQEEEESASHREKLGEMRLAEELKLS